MATAVMRAMRRGDGLERVCACFRNLKLGHRRSGQIPELRWLVPREPVRGNDAQAGKSKIAALDFIRPSQGRRQIFRSTPMSYAFACERSEVQPTFAGRACPSSHCADVERRLRVRSFACGLKGFRALFTVTLALFAVTVQPANADPLAVKVGVIHETHSRETISILDIPPADDFVAGARMAMDDNNTTGRFLDQSFSVVDAKLALGEDPVAPLNRMLADGVRYFIVDLAPAEVLAVADAARASGALVFNAGAPDDRLREEDCRANVIHVAPTRSMLADGLAQYLIWKKWRRWLLVVGSHPEDKLLADAYRQSAKKFGAKIVEERVYEDTGGGRRSDSGSVQVQRQMPVFTQSVPDYDILVAADENEVFAGYLPYRTWDPRPVVGSAGLQPTSWDPSHELWGAAQLQNRFERLFKRGMNVRDNQAWVAMRIIGDAVAHMRSADPKTIHDNLLSPDFAVGAFKGQKLTLRAWNQQLRQPILLTDGRGTVSVSPQEGFLHETSELDTLGFDKPETKCKLH
jgi:ABC transporter substrate binding protein (PQQ-dependent alcohol dehydrogenase system)